jgi:glutamyl-tRNA synthetase
MDDLRKDRKKSARRDESIESNLARLAEMKTGSDKGQKWCIRAKIKYDSSNEALRDPVIYRYIVKTDDDTRTNLVSHHRTGTKWKIYPTYDFCCPILDSIESVTRTPRTIGYRDRNPQYEWILKILNLRPVEIRDFSRMNFIRTLLSKCKLARLVESGAVSVWDDPRFPTIRSIRRRGMTCLISATSCFSRALGATSSILTGPSSGRPTRN